MVNDSRYLPARILNILNYFQHVVCGVWDKKREVGGGEGEREAGKNKRRGGRKKEGREGGRGRGKGWREEGIEGG